MKLLLPIICHIVTLTESTLNVHNKMYTQLDATSPCIVRLNGSQSFGCTSSRNGNVGVIHIVHNDTDVLWVTNATRTDNYIAAMFLDMFSFENLKKLNDSEHVTGVLLMQKRIRSKVSNFSPEDKCPNRYSGLAAPPREETVCDATSPWNPTANEISMHKWKMPIFFSADNRTISQVEDCFRKHNLPLDNQADRPLCALKMSAHMFGSVDSTTCIRRSSTAYNINPIRYCDPLGDENIYVPAVPFDRYKKPKKYVIVAARLDSTSFFYSLAPGALSAATSLVTLLLTSSLLIKLVREADVNTIQQNVLFILFNGEAYDYIGSSRVAYDMDKGQFPFKEDPITKEQVSLFVELSQLWNNQSVTYHVYKNEDPIVTKFINTFRNQANHMNFAVDLKQKIGNVMPPASFQSFLATKPTLPGFVFASYDQHFQNRFYHSLYDDSMNVGYEYTNGSGIVSPNSLQKFVANFSTVLAYTLFEVIGSAAKSGSRLPEVVGIADELLHCYVDTMKCRFFADAGFDVNSLPSSKLDLYVGVMGIRNQITTLTKLTLVHLTGRKTEAKSSEECLSKVQNTTYTVWFTDNSVCLESAVNVSEALSPAFVIPEYKLSEGVYPSWTESSWQTIDVRMFLKPSPKYEWLVFVIGNSVMIASILTVFWIKHHARELFNYPHLITAANI